MTIAPVDLRTNTLTAPLGIDTAHPELAWKLETDLPGVTQASYEVEVSSSADFGHDVVWGSGRVHSPEPFGVRYRGTALLSSRRYWWRVRTWCDVRGRDAQVETAWSPAAWFETAVLDPSLWTARWVSGGAPTSKADDAVVYFRGSHELPAGVVRARAYVSAHGWYRFFVNGQDQTGDALVPRWTPFDRIVEYQTYDVTSALREGTNLLAVAVGDGRFRGGIGLGGSRNTYGDRVAAFVQLEVDLADGSRLSATTGPGWTAGAGRITGSDPKNGERVDLRIDDAGWHTAAVPPAHFRPVDVEPADRVDLVAEEVGRVRAVERLRATVSRVPSGAQILDFGQNFAGVVRIRLAGPAGSTVRLTHSELLSPDGEIDVDYQQMGKKWYQREVVVLGDDPQWFQPWFTIHGFRYVEVVGLDQTVAPEDVEGVVLSTDMPTTGRFRCSDPRLEQLHSNVTWSLRSNFTDTPTDCPTRERSGWTGDIQVFAATGAVMVDEQAYLRRYLRNLVLEQHPDGAVPLFIPSERPTTPGLARRMVKVMSRSAGWADVAVLLPWTLYRYYGDEQVLAGQYDSMRRWVDQMQRAARRRSLRRRLLDRDTVVASVDQDLILDTGFHFGEWLRPGDNALTSIARHLVHPPAEIATAYFAHSTRVLADAAAVLGRDADHQRYGRLAREVRAAWRGSFVRTDGTGALRIAQDRQEDYVRGLAFDLLEPSERQPAADRLAELVRDAGDHLSTGFLSTAMLLGCLTEGGHGDTAVRLLLQTTNPSWLHQIQRGATTVWETWEGYKPDGQGKESHNHYAFGAVAGWLTEGLAGLSPAAPGYRTIDVRPLVTERLTHVSASVETPYGTAGSAWRRSDGDVTLAVSVPAGATAHVHLPAAAGQPSPQVVPSGDHTFSWRERLPSDR